MKLAVHKRGVAILILGESRVVRSIIVQPRTVNCCGAGLQVVLETHSRPSWDLIHCAAVSVQHQWLSPGHPEDGKAKSVTTMEYYCW